jgi:potassium/chloride transporter 4/5/6
LTVFLSYFSFGIFIFYFGICSTVFFFFARWGVLIFLRFHTIIGQAGVLHAFLIVLLSFFVALLTTFSLSAIATSGSVASTGGPYRMVSRALGPTVGATVGLVYFLGLILLCVLESLGAVEALGMLHIGVEKWGGWGLRGMGVGVVGGLAAVVGGGDRVVAKFGVVFVSVVIGTLATFYSGLAGAPATMHNADLSCVFFFFFARGANSQK